MVNFYLLVMLFLSYGMQSYQVELEALALKLEEENEQLQREKVRILKSFGVIGIRGGKWTFFFCCFGNLLFEFLLLFENGMVPSESCTLRCQVFL